MSLHICSHETCDFHNRKYVQYIDKTKLSVNNSASQGSPDWPKSVIEYLHIKFNLSKYTLLHLMAHPNYHNTTFTPSTANGTSQLILMCYRYSNFSSNSLPHTMVLLNDHFCIISKHNCLYNTILAALTVSLHQ